MMMKNITKNINFYFNKYHHFQQLKLFILLYLYQIIKKIVKKELIKNIMMDEYQEKQLFIIIIFLYLFLLHSWNLYLCFIIINFIITII